MPAVPAFILPRLYVKDSLRNADLGFDFVDEVSDWA